MLQGTKNRKAVREACELFVKKARRIETVNEVILVDDDEGLTVWTVISAPAFDKSARMPIYEAITETLNTLKEPLLDFHTLNLQELPDDSARENVVPTNSETLWKRRNAK